MGVDEGNLQVICRYRALDVCCVFSSHSFWTSSSLDVPAGVTQKEGHAGFLIHLSAVRALIFLARRTQPRSAVKRRVFAGGGDGDQIFPDKV